MIPLSKRTVLIRGRHRVLPFALSACAALSLVSGALHASPVPANLGNGLDRLVRSQLDIQKPAYVNGAVQTHAAEDGRVYSTEQSAALANLALKDEYGRFLVRVYGDGTMKLAKVRKNIKAQLVSFTTTATAPTYKGMGVMNAYVALEEVTALATVPGVRSVVLELKPRHNGKFNVVDAQAAPVAPNATVGQVYPNLGTFFDQGVIQHRVDTVSKFYNASAPVDYQGSGLAIACISNSYGANAAHPATLDVTNGDLPGASNNPAGNTTPVFVLQDDLSSTTSDDEGRGMCQIVYHMAPKAAVGFATANTGEVGFANNIRGLANLPGFGLPGQTFAADVICDDVGYFDEPFYEDGIIGAGIEDVAAAGVSYFSSSANDIGLNGYESVIRLVPPGTGLTAAAGNTSLAGTNINLAGVPTNLYAGGFHNFNPNGLDVAQTVNVAANNTVQTVLQWNDPYDQNTTATGGTTLFSGSGNYVATPVTFTVNAPVTQGAFYQVTETAVGSSFDGIVTVYKSDGTTVIAGPQDTGTDEVVRFPAPANDTGFVVKVDHFSTTTGAFSLTVQSFTGFSTPSIGSDWNLLAFRTDTGAYVPASSLTTNNLVTNQPIELGFVNRTSAAVTSIQYVFALANTPTGPHIADHIRYVIPGNGRAGYGPQEYFSYNTVTTSGHATSLNCNGTAAYSPFRPNIPESFTSPGPATFYYDKNDNFLATPEIRLQPRVAACDGANISVNEGLAGLGSDSASDYDVAANFSGTSAAAPHAAACALLALEAHGGRRSVTPAQMTSLLQRSAFPHDLDPNSCSGTAKAGGSKISLTFNSDNESNTGTGVNDANSLTVSYTGPSYIASLVFNPAGTAATGGNTTGGNNGLDATNAYTSNSFPGMVFPAATTTFAVGTGSVGLAAADVTATTSNLAPAPSTTQNWTLTLGFPNSNFTGGKVLHFTINRLIQHSSVVPSGSTGASFSADLFGGSVLIPEGTGTGTGMAFTATLGNGTVLNGTLNNRIGAGYSVLDGYGFINVQAAANLPVQ